MMKKNKLNDRKRTFLLITIPIVALFFCFNTLPLIKGVIYSFTNFKGYGSYDWVGLRNYKRPVYRFQGRRLIYLYI